MKKNIYTISHYGSIQHYYHFLFAVLIPLLYYDLTCGNKTTTYIMKINLGNMFNILKLIYGNRIKTNYIKPTNNELTDKFNYFGTYIDISQHNNDSDILLNAFDIFNDKRYKQINTKSFNYNEYKKLHQIYIFYYYSIYHNMPNECDNKFKKNCYKKITTNRYRELNFTNDYIKLNNCRLIINNFFNSKITNKTIFPIILIERKIPTNFTNELKNNAGGQRRIIYNHDQLKNKLSKIYKSEFKNIILEELTIYEQFNIFNNAKIIIGQHGAGLSNIFFCKDNTTIIEISPEWDDEHEFKNLSSFARLTYHNVKQDRMTKKEFKLFNKNYKKLYNNDNETDFIDKIFKELDKPYNKYADDPILSFIRNSGSVDIDEIISKIKI